MPWTVDDPPPPCKHYSYEERKSCADIANALLRGGYDEGSAIRIAAAIAKRGVRVKQHPTEEQEEQYQEEQRRVAAELYALGQRLAEGKISLEEFEVRMRAILWDFFIAVAMIATDGMFDEENEEDLADLEGLLAEREGHLQGFIADIRAGKLSAAQIAWRAGLFAGVRHLFVRFTVSRRAFVVMPYFPGISCLGDGWCQCWLEEIEEPDGTVIIYWHLGQSEHCAVCLKAESESPYIFYPSGE